MKMKRDDILLVAMKGLGSRWVEDSNTLSGVFHSFFYPNSSSKFPTFISMVQHALLAFPIQQPFPLMRHVNDQTVVRTANTTSSAKDPTNELNAIARPHPHPNDCASGLPDSVLAAFAHRLPGQGQALTERFTLNKHPR